MARRFLVCHTLLHRYASSWRQKVLERGGSPRSEGRAPCRQKEDRHAQKATEREARKAAAAAHLSVAWRRSAHVGSGRAKGATEQHVGARKDLLFTLDAANSLRLPGFRRSWQAWERQRTRSGSSSPASCARGARVFMDRRLGWRGRTSKRTLSPELSHMRTEKRSRCAPPTFSLSLSGRSGRSGRSLEGRPNKPGTFEREDDQILEEGPLGKCVLESILDQLETGNLRADSLAELVSFRLRCPWSRQDQEEAQESVKSHAAQHSGAAGEICEMGQCLGRAPPPRSGRVQNFQSMRLRATSSVEQ